MKARQKRSSRPAHDEGRRRIFIVDDHPVTRLGLIQLLNSQPDLVVCGEADDARQALLVIKPPLPHLVVTDVAMPGMSVIEFIKQMHTLHRGVPVLVLSTHEESIYAERLIRAGARGYIMKSEGGANLVAAICQILKGEPYLSTKMSAKAFEKLSGGRAAASNAVLGRLTDREFEVFELLGKGHTNREVAQQLCISPKTVEVHRLNLCHKLNLKTPTQLIRFAVEHEHGGVAPR